MTKVLMSADNPDGWKLEELLSQLRDEIVAKTDKVKNDQRITAQMLVRNNRSILRLLTAAEQLQRESLEELAMYRHDEGPSGTPRVGIGSEGYDLQASGD